MAARLAAVGGLAFAVPELDRRRPSNGFARLGLAQPGCQQPHKQRAARAAGIINMVVSLGIDTERVSASFGNNPLRETHPIGNP
jgi:hypothetical protein